MNERKFYGILTMCFVIVFTTIPAFVLLMGPSPYGEVFVSGFCQNIPARMLVALAVAVIVFTGNMTVFVHVKKWVKSEV